MGTFSLNSTLKVSAAISGNTSSTGTIYTCPASSYAIVNLVISPGSGTVVIQMNGNRLLHQSTGTNSGNVSTITYTIHVGPSQTIQVTTNSAGAANVAVSGVEFINSP